MTQKIKQIIIYKIQPEKLSEFEQIKAQMISESLTLNGLYSSTTSKLLSEDNLYADSMIWESQAAAEKALPQFGAAPYRSSIHVHVCRPSVA